MKNQQRKKKLRHKFGKDSGDQLLTMLGEVADCKHQKRYGDARHALQQCLRLECVKKERPPREAWNIRCGARTAVASCFCAYGIPPARPIPRAAEQGIALIAPCALPCGTQRSAICE